MNKIYFICLAQLGFFSATAQDIYLVSKMEFGSTFRRKKEM